MASRVDFHFKQRVTEAELDLAFTLLEQADHDLAADLGIYGIISGAAPAQHSPVPDLSVDLTSPTRAYDRLGQRIFFGTDQTIDCASDLVGIPTEITIPGNARWLGVFLRFTRQLSDPRTDGNAQQVFFRHDESFEIIVRQAPEGPSGSEQRVALQADELLICDVHRGYAQSQLLNADIDLSRRQAFIFAQGDAVGVQSGAWTILQPALETAQAALDEVDTELNTHFAGAGRRHPAAAIDFSPSGFITSDDLQAALTELITLLSSATSGSPGARLIGADAIPGSPHVIPASNINSQLSQLLNLLNNHVSAATAAHHASAINSAPHGHISSTSVQAQLQEIVNDLSSTLSSQGANLVGNASLSGSPHTLASGNLRSHVWSLLTWLNEHINGGDHDARYYKSDEQVGDADTLDGQHADAFAAAGHDHDDHYLRRIYNSSRPMDPGSSIDFTTLLDRPDLVTISYNHLDASNLPQATTYIRGQLSDDLRLWVTKLDQGDDDKDYRITAQNLSAEKLYVTVTAYRRD